MTVATRTRVKLVVEINHRDGSYRNGWFRVVSIHRKKTAARRRAVTFRRKGYLARVRSFCGYWLVAVRRPRKIAPAYTHLEA